MFCPVFVPISGVIPTDRQRWNVGAAVERALVLANIPRKVAADLMGVKESALSRQLAGCGPDHITADALTCLPIEFWVWFCLLTLEHYDLFPGTRSLAARAAVGTLRMARAALRGKDGANAVGRIVA